MSRTWMTAAAATSIIAMACGAVAAQTADAMKQEGPDVWRASKLPGVAVFGPDNKKVGNVTDVLMDHSGKATGIVIGVGGFLGLGEKDVALPFDQVTFTDQPITPPQPAGGVATNTANSSGATAATGLGMPANSAGGTNAPGTAATATGVGGAPASAAPASTLGTPTANAPGGAVPGATGMAAAPASPVDSAPRSTAYPDHGTIALTADQLKSAASFQFAK